MVNRTGRRSVSWSEVERALRAADYPEDSMGADEDHLRYTGRAEAVAIIRDMLSIANADDAHPLPVHRTEAGYPRCATCDGGGCLDCTDPA